jgi:aromatic-L-amino-acid decarboxylase
MSVTAAYIAASGDARDQMDWTPEWTRRARGFPVYAALRQLGRRGVEAMIDDCCDHAEALSLGIGQLGGAELVARPTLNQGLVRFLDPRSEATDADHDTFTDRVVSAINAEGTALFSGGAWRGRRVMRISVVNARTLAEDVQLTIRAVAKVLGGPPGK